MKKIIFGLMLIAALVGLVGCSLFHNSEVEMPGKTATEVEEAINKIAEENNISNERKEEIIKNLEESTKENKKIEERVQKVIEKNNITEKEYDQDCEHEYVKYLEKIKGEKYEVEVNECIKCGGRNIAGHVNSEEGKTVEDFGKELDSLLADW